MLFIVKLCSSFSFLFSEPYEDQKEVDPKAAALTHNIVFRVHNRGPSAVDGLILQMSVPWSIDTVDVLNVGFITRKSDIFLCPIS